ncbi:MULTISPECIES: hypothetical protein [Bacillaceae]|uniref:hypothetical protein n=1 Tax=Bacillaceae TaxID=186817 RepID=UPI00053A0A22|nr:MULTISPECIES: hypothetical protein [Bacillaceae]
MASKVFDIVNKTYRYISLSFLFWLYTVKGLMIYSIISAPCAIFKTFETIRTENKDIEISKEYKRNAKKFDKTRLPSFILAFVTISIISLLFLLAKTNSPYTLLFSIILIYLLCTAYVYIVYLSYHLSILNKAGKEAYILAYVAIFRNFGISLSLVVMMILLIAVAWYNLFLFFVIAPSILYRFAYYVLSKRLPKRN